MNPENTERYWRIMAANPEAMGQNIRTRAGRLVEDLFAWELSESQRRQAWSILYQIFSHALSPTEATSDANNEYLKALALQLAQHTSKDAPT